MNYLKIIYYMFNAIPDAVDYWADTCRIEYGQNSDDLALDIFDRIGNDKKPYRVTLSQFNDSLERLHDDYLANNVEAWQRRIVSTILYEDFYDYETVDALVQHVLFNQIVYS